VISRFTVIIKYLLNKGKDTTHLSQCWNMPCERSPPVLSGQTITTGLIHHSSRRMAILKTHGHLQTCCLSFLHRGPHSRGTTYMKTFGHFLIVGRPALLFQDCQIGLFSYSSDFWGHKSGEDLHCLRSGFGIKNFELSCKRNRRNGRFENRYIMEFGIIQNNSILIAI
jgi:hypothetical protein